MKLRELSRLPIVSKWLEIHPPSPHPAAAPFPVHRAVFLGEERFLNIESGGQALVSTQPITSLALNFQLREVGMVSCCCFLVQFISKHLANVYWILHHLSWEYLVAPRSHEADLFFGLEELTLSWKQLSSKNLVSESNFLFVLWDWHEFLIGSLANTAGSYSHSFSLYTSPSFVATVWTFSLALSCLSAPPMYSHYPSSLWKTGNVAKFGSS